MPIYISTPIGYGLRRYRRHVYSSFFLRSYADTVSFQSTPHCYHVAVVKGLGQLDLHSNPVAVRVPPAPTEARFLPSPRYLRIHAAVCKVAWMSGAAKYHNSSHQDLDDGNSDEFADVLMSRLEVLSSPSAPFI